MQKTLLLFIVAVCFSVKASAQSFSAAYFSDNLGKSKTLCDKVGSVHIFNDTLTHISMGGKHPNEKYIIAVKGNKLTLDWAHLKGKTMCVTGVFEMRDNRPYIVAAQPDQIQFP